MFYGIGEDGLVGTMAALPAMSLGLAMDGADPPCPRGRLLAVPRLANNTDRSRQVTDLAEPVGRALTRS